MGYVLLCENMFSFDGLVEFVREKVLLCRLDFVVSYCWVEFKMLLLFFRLLKMLDILGFLLQVEVFCKDDVWYLQVYFFFQICVLCVYIFIKSFEVGVDMWYGLVSGLVVILNLGYD